MKSLVENKHILRFDAELGVSVGVSPSGLPKAVDQSVKDKLEECFAIDATVEEACFYADISRDTFYAYIKANPGFADRLASLRERPVLKARQTVIKNLDKTDTAKWYLERKKKMEFASQQQIQTVAINANVDLKLDPQSKLVQEFEARLFDNLNDDDNRGTISSGQESDSTEQDSVS